MNFIITKKDLHESLIGQLVEAVRGRDFSFFTDSMNRVFIEQTPAIKNEYFFEMLQDFSVFEDDIFLLENNEAYENAYKAILKMIEKDFKIKNKKTTTAKEEDPFS